MTMTHEISSDKIKIQGECEMTGQTLRMSSIYQNKKMSSYKYGPTNTSFPCYSTERMNLQKLLKITSM